MATVNKGMDDSAYVLLSSVDCVVINISSNIMRLRFDVALPAVDADSFYIRPNDAFQRSNSLPAGNLYGRCDKEGGSCIASVSE